MRAGIIERRAARLVGGGRATPTATASPIPSGAPTASAEPSAAADAAVETVVDGLVAPVGLVAPPDGTGRLFVLEQTGLISVLQPGGRRGRRRSSISATGSWSSGRTTTSAACSASRSTRTSPTNGRALRRTTARRTATAGAAGSDHTNTLSEFQVDPAHPIERTRHPSGSSSSSTSPSSTTAAAAWASGRTGCCTSARAMAAVRATPARAIRHRATPRTWPSSTARSCGSTSTASGRTRSRRTTAQIDGARPEIYAYGFRNPWRLVVGAGRRAAAPGQRRRVRPLRGDRRRRRAAANYGWRIREGTHCLDVDQPLTETADCPTTGAAGEPLVDPVLEYAHKDVGVAVVGGYVYRGSAIAGLRDRYVFADFSADPDNNLSFPRGSMLVATPVDGDRHVGLAAARPRRWRPQSIRDRDGRGRCGRAVRPDEDATRAGRDDGRGPEAGPAGRLDRLGAGLPGSAHTRQPSRCRQIASARSVQP